MLNEEQSRAEIVENGYNVESFCIIKEEDNKLIAKVVFNEDNGEFTKTGCLKVYDTKRFDQIERVYTVLSLLATKLTDEAKKNNESFMNLLPVIYKTWKKDNLFFVLEEKIEGETLAESIKTDKYSSFSDFVKIMKQICDAVAMLHKPFPPIVHCDIKEGNVMMDNSDQIIKIFDFDASYVEGSGTYNNVRSTKGYRPTEMVNSSPVSQSDIYAIGCIMENIVSYAKWKNQLDSQCNDSLKQIIIKSKEEVSRRYYNVNELKDALSEVEILSMLNEKMNALDEMGRFIVYSYTNDIEGYIDKVKEVLTNYMDVDVLYIAKYGNQTLAFTIAGVYFMTYNKGLDIQVINYNELIACRKIKTEKEENVLACITKSFSGQWNTINIPLPAGDIDFICEILNSIVLCKKSYYTVERIADYYSNKCKEAYEILRKKELSGNRHEFDIWWNRVINLGELASEKEEDIGKSPYTCENILLKVYSNKRRYLRHKLKEENKYSDERLVNEILQTYSFEEKINEETAQGSRNDFLAWLDEQKQSSMQEGDKDKAAKAMGGLAGFFGGKKED